MQQIKIIRFFIAKNYNQIFIILFIIYFLLQILRLIF
jgi:hypothetical protein